MLFKDIKLNRDNLEKVLDIYAKNNYSTYSLNKIVKSQILTRYNIVFEEKKLFLDFHFNNKGGTTIQVNNGQEQEEKKKIATFLSTHPLCLMEGSNENNRSMLFKDIDKENFSGVIEIIKEESENCSKVLSEIQDDTKILIKLEGRWSDKVTITYNKNTENVRVQGRPLVLYNEITSFFNEVIDNDKIVETLEENFQQNINPKSIEEQYINYLPNSYDKHTDKLKKSLTKAVYNLNVTSQEYTCTELAFEVLRALEGHVKLTLLRDFNIRSTSKHGTLTMFSFDENTSVATMREPARTTVKNKDKITYFEKAYKYIVVYRHKIFHWDYPDVVGMDQTIQFEDVNDVKQIIIDILSVIDEYYSI